MSIDRFLPRARRLPLIPSSHRPPPPVDPQRSLALFVAPFAFALSFLLPRPFSTSPYSPFSPPSLPRVSTPRVFLFPLFSSRVLFFARFALSYAHDGSSSLSTVLYSLPSPIRLFSFFSLCELRPNNPAQQPTPTPKTRKLRCFVSLSLSLPPVLRLSVFTSSRR